MDKKTSEYIVAAVSFGLGLLLLYTNGYRISLGLFLGIVLFVFGICGFLWARRA